MKFYIFRLLSRKTLLLSFIGLGTAIGFLVTLLSSPTYHSKARILLDADTALPSSDLTAAQPTAIKQLLLIKELTLRRETLLDFADIIELDNSENQEDVYERARRSVSIDISADRHTLPVLTVGYSAHSAEVALKGARELIKKVLQQDAEGLSLGVNRIVKWHQNEVSRLKQELDNNSHHIFTFKRENKDALPNNLPSYRLQLAAQRKRLSQIIKQIEMEKRQRLDVVLPPQKFESRKVGEKLHTLSRNKPSVVTPKPDDALTLLETHRKDISSKLESLTRLIDTTQYNAVQLENLEQARDNIRAQLLEASSNLTRAHSAEQSAASDYGQRLTIFEPAQLPTRVTGIIPPMIIFISMIGGLIIGLLSVIVVETYARIIRRPQDLIKHLGVTPISTLPYIPAHSTRA